MYRILIAFLILSAGSSFSHAEIFRCVDEAGNVSFTTKPGPDCVLLTGSVDHTKSSPLSDRGPVRSSSSDMNDTHPDPQQKIDPNYINSPISILRERLKGQTTKEVRKLLGNPDRIDVLPGNARECWIFEGADRGIVFERYRVLEVGNHAIGKHQRFAANPIVVEDSCYQLGIKYGFCAAKSLDGVPCKPENDIVIPLRCRGEGETQRGIKVGIFMWQNRSHSE